MEYSLFLKRTILIFSFKFFIVIALFSQARNLNDSLYIISLEKYSDQIETFYAKYAPNSKEKYNSFFLETSDLMEFVTDSICNHKVIVLSNNNRINLYKENGNQLINLKIFPIEIENNNIKITLIPYHGYLDSENEITLELGDWTNVYFKFDCNKKHWIYDYTENGGI